MNIPPDKLISEEAFRDSLRLSSFREDRIPRYGDAIPLASGMGPQRMVIFITAVRGGPYNLAALVRVGGPIPTIDQGVWDDNDPNLFLCPDIQYLIPDRSFVPNRVEQREVIGPDGTPRTLPLVIKTA